MRVISGTARGRKLVAPEGSTTRPTPDRVREATFNALGSLHAVAGARVLDLFAGSGALGIEALSRGAAHVTFVDRDRAAIRAVNANLATCGLGDAATVVTAEAVRYLAGTSERWDLALLDPPYAHDRDAWLDLLDVLPSDLAVLESDRELEGPFGWDVLRAKRYGSTVVTIVERHPI
jgi:16S rRNA (guanine966-N2)-methyltransferase